MSLQGAFACSYVTETFLRFLIRMRHICAMRLTHGRKQLKFFVSVSNRVSQSAFGLLMSKVVIASEQKEKRRSNKVVALCPLRWQRGTVYSSWKLAASLDEISRAIRWGTVSISMHGDGERRKTGLHIPALLCEEIWDSKELFLPVYKGIER